MQLSSGDTTILPGILFYFEIVKGNDHPSEMSRPRYAKHGKTASLLMRLCDSIAQSCCYVVLYSEFCVLAAICVLRSVMDIFAGVLIKKQCFWPALVPGNDIDMEFEALDVGDATSVKRMIRRVPYSIWCMKDVGYVTKIMGKGMGLGYPDDRMCSR